MSPQALSESARQKLRFIRAIGPAFRWRCPLDMHKHHDNLNIENYQKYQIRIERRKDGRRETGQVLLQR